MPPTVGVVSAGDMGAAIGAALAANGVDAATSLAGRGALTRTRAAEAGMRDAGGVAALVEECGLLLSVVPPASAVSVAEEVADAIARTGARPVFAECNAVAPRTAQRIATLIGDAGAPVIDAGIIGPPPAPGSRTRIYCSGPDTAPLEALREYGLDVRRVGPDVGQASGLKMVYAASTKGTTAVWTELLTAAEAMGLTDALLAEFGDAPGPARAVKSGRKCRAAPADGSAKWRRSPRRSRRSASRLASCSARRICSASPPTRPSPTKPPATPTPNCGRCSAFSRSARGWGRGDARGAARAP